MSPDELARAEILFDEALALPQDQRQAFLEDRCASDPALRQSVQKLLDAHSRSEGHLEAIVGRAAESTLVPVQEPDHFDDWRIERKLGQGGMGVVYLAHREKDGLLQTAAIKVLRFGQDSPELTARFRDERRILASLAHPNIAGLLDGGATPHGVPWFAMEYVEGLPLHRYCDQQNLSASQRIALVRTICLAVHHAHRNLIIHRDLKPSNILVTVEGIPKLLDFGIAKLIGPDVDSTAETRIRMLTPDYASPEQLRGGPVTTATDIYSLAVVLYELLTGRQPTPGVPSGLPTDLDRILQKSLREEPERRYASAEALAEDLRRYLEGFPVSARPDTWGYVARRFVQRHRAVSLIVAASLLGLCTLTAVALRQRQLALRESETAEAALTFLSSVFSAPNPDESLGANTTATQLLTAGAQRIDTELQAQPEVRARLQAVMASAYRGLAQFDDAEKLLRSSLRSREQLFGRQSKEVAETLADLGATLYENGKAAEAVPLHAEALATRERLLGPDHPVTADSLFESAIVLEDLGQRTEAEAYLRRAIPIFQKHRGPRSSDVADALQFLGDTLRHDGKFALALPYHLEALEIRKEAKGPNHPDTAHSLNAIGRAHIQMGHPKEAVPYIEGALRIQRQVFGDSHPATSASRSNLAGALSSLGEYDKSIALYSETLRHLEARYGERHPYVGGSYYSVGQVLLEKGDLSAAQPYIEKSVAIHRKLLPPDHPDLARALTQRGVLLHRARQLPAAEKQLREVEAIQRKRLKPTDPDLARTFVALGACLRDQRQFAEAERLLLAGHESLRASRGETHPFTRTAASHVVKLYEQSGQSAKAEPWRPKANPL